MPQPNTPPIRKGAKDLNRVKIDPAWDTTMNWFYFSKACFLPNVIKIQNVRLNKPENSIRTENSPKTIIRGIKRSIALTLL